MTFIDLHTHKKQHPQNISAIVNRYPDDDETGSMFSVGLHPWYLDSATLEDEFRKLEKLLALKNCVAIGECGLDKRTQTAFDLQSEVFKRHLGLAGKYQKPVIVHCVASFQEVIAARNRMTEKVPMIIHGYSKGLELATQLIEQGFYLSFGTRILTHEPLLDVLKSVPVNRVFFESDSADVDVSEVYKVAAKYLEMDVTELCKQVESNFNEVFKYKI